MIKQIQELEYDNPQLCILILATATLAYRPLHVLELRPLTGLQEEIPDLQDLERIISMCGSFLTIRDNYVYFIHQSAKDYLTVNAPTTIFPAGPGQIHCDMFSWSLDALSKTLQRDIYNLQDPGCIMWEIPDPDPLAAIEYSCVFLLDHLCEIDSQSLDHRKELSDDGGVLAFLKVHFLHWLESLSLIHKLSDGVLSIRKLLHYAQVC
jgi:hypothetical protein